jgi:hypothetical protein
LGEYWLYGVVITASSLRSKTKDSVFSLFASENAARYTGEISEADEPDRGRGRLMRTHNPPHNGLIFREFSAEST